jgi:hypothetical protein
MTTKKAQHTPAPWKAIRNAGGIFIMANGIPVARLDGPIDAVIHAARIVAAVNACDGIPTDALEQGAVKDLVGALERLTDRVDPGNKDRDLGIKSLVDALGDARAALAKARGE